jgi:hypothetical protein
MNDNRHRKVIAVAAYALQAPSLTLRPSSNAANGKG